MYEQMSYCYFYLGKMKKAEYFNTRYRMGVLEEADSQVSHIYASLRRNFYRRHNWDTQIQYVSDLAWKGESIFELFYNNFLEDCINKERIVQDLTQGKAFPAFDQMHGKGELTKLLAISLLKKVGSALREIKNQKKTKSPVRSVAQPPHSFLKLEP